MKIEKVLETIYARQVRTLGAIVFDNCPVTLTRREFAAIKRAYARAPRSVLGERLPFPENLELCRQMRHVVETGHWN